MKKVMFYCQHVLGMGHLMRSMALLEGLSREFKICFLNGGELIDGFDFPTSVELVNLPALKSDANFDDIHATGGQSLEEIQAWRTQRILDTYDHLQPDVVMIELFPFGRKKFAYELVPLLARIQLDNQASGDATKVVCSLRDILVSKRQQIRHEARVCRLMNKYYDLLLVHADPKFQRLDETFPSFFNLKIPIEYTGYVAQSIGSTLDRGRLRADDDDTFLTTIESPLIVASIGGGRVGYELLNVTVKASQILATSSPHHLLIFTGPYLPEEQFQQLEQLTSGQAHITLRRYTTRFLAFMEQAALSISMAGYNTCMNILTTATPALVLPFTGRGNEEQTMRASKLETLGILKMLQLDELEPSRLAHKMRQQFQAEPTTNSLNLNGVENSVIALKALLPQSVKIPQSMEIQVRHQSPQFYGHEVIQTKLRPYLEQRLFESHGGNNSLQDFKFHLFLRNDDVDDDEKTLHQLLDIGLGRNVPLNLQIIPTQLTTAGIRVLKEHRKFHPTLFELNQHGWQHINHERQGRKCEFGVSRTFEEQLADIAAGKTLLEEIFSETFSAVFTPPWNRCTEDTFRAVDQLGFDVFSMSGRGHRLNDYAFREISVTLDIFRWKGNPTLKSPDEIIDDLIAQLDSAVSHPYPIGIMLHHKVMDANAFAFLDGLLAELTRHSYMQFHTFQALLRIS